MRFKNPYRLCTHKVMMTDVLAQALAGETFIFSSLLFYRWVLIDFHLAISVFLWI